MIQRGFKKKSSKSPLSKKDNLKTIKKSTSKSKPKKKINPTEYLQALIDLQNTNCSTNRKKKCTKRDISSALTIATPALQKTISSSKVRSKSSFSHYRKKSSEKHAQVVTLNICAVITEESNVQYTQKTARSSTQQKKQIERIKQQCSRINRKRNELMSIIKIQRAWRNYQTYKMVSQHYQIQRKIQRQGKHFQENQLYLNPPKKRLQKKILIIKKGEGKKKQERKNLQVDQTNKIIMQRYRQKQSQQLSEDKQSQSIGFEMSSISRITEKTPHSYIEDLKEKEMERINDTIDFISVKSKQNSKQELLNELMKKIQENKKILEEDFKNKIQSFQREKQMIEQQERNQSNSSSQQFSSPMKENSIREIQNIDIRSFLSEQSNFGFQLDGCDSQKVELKVFQYRLQEIKSIRNKSMLNIDDAIQNGMLSIYQATKKREKIQFNYQKQRRQIQKNRKQYTFSLMKLKKNALKCHGWLLKQSSSLKKLRKSFSAGNVVLKNVFESIKIDQLAELQLGNDFIDSLFNPIEAIKDAPLLNTPIRSEYSGIKDSQISEGLQNSTQIMKEYSEQIQELIQKYLFEEIVYQIYKNDNLFSCFKPYVGQVYEFKRISDQQIMEYWSALAQFMPHQSKILKRVNQKINPTTIEILRIIRDFDFEIEEYELIIPEEVFKKYRQNLEKQYKLQQINYASFQTKIEEKILDKEVAKLVEIRELQKKDKRQKYRNFERDLKIMYMKAVFNCLNEFFIETKSLNSFMNSRSAIGPGELKFALKEFNEDYDILKYRELQIQVQKRLKNVLNLKCAIPSFKNYNDLERYQQQVMSQIKHQSTENEYKWVNYMDQILEIWQDLSLKISEQLINQATRDFLSLF